MMNGQMVGLDHLKADLANSKLLVHSVHTEKGVKRSNISDALDNELRVMAAWLELDL